MIKTKNKICLIIISVIALFCMSFGALMLSSFSASTVSAEASGTELKPIVRYEFKDSTNLGKDSMGNFDLETYGTGLTNGTDDSGSYLNFAKTGGLYAKELSTSADFSDYIKSDYTISFGLKRTVVGGSDWGSVISTSNGGYAHNIAGNNGITIFAANSCIDTKLTTNTAGTDYVSNVANTDISDTKWGIVTIIYNNTAKQLNVYIDGSLRNTFSGEFTLNVQHFAFCIGMSYYQVRKNTIGDCASTGSIRDVRVYDCALSASNVSALSNGNTIYADSGSNIIENVTATANYKVKTGTSDTALLGMNNLINVVATDTNETSYADLNCLTTNIVDNSNGTKSVQGIILDSRVRNGACKKVNCTVEYYTTGEEIKPVVHYEFKDSSNLGKDSMGNFDLNVVGTELKQGDDNASLDFSGNSTSYLRAKNLGDSKSFANYMAGSCTVSFKTKKDISGNDWSVFVGAGDANGGISIQYANNNLYAFTGGSVYLMASSVSGSINASNYATVTVTYDAVTTIGTMYINGICIVSGNLASGLPIDDGCAFALGAMSWYNGSSQEYLTNGCISDVRVYDCALNHQNVIDLANGTEATINSDTEVISEIGTKTAKIDSSLTDSDIIADKTFAPDTVSVKTSKGNTVSVPVIGYKISRTDSAITLSGIIYGTTSNPKGLAYTVSLDFATYSVSYASVSLNGDIGLNFYVSLPTYLTSNPTANIGMTETTSSVIGEHVDSLDLWKFTYNVAPKDYKETVSISLTVNDKAVSGSYSVEQYLTNVKDTESHYNLCQKMKNYCESARAYFANETVTATADITDRLDSYKYTVSGSNDKVTLAGTTLVLETKTTIRVYFKADEDIVCKIDGGVVEVKTSGNFKYIELVDIAVKDLGTAHSFEVGGITVNYSAISYVVSTSQAEDTALANVVKSLYDFYKAGDAYFNA